MGFLYLFHYARGVRLKLAGSDPGTAEVETTARSATTSPRRTSAAGQAKTYHVDLCNVEESAVPGDQRAFDQEVVGSAPFLRSNGDFVRTSDCAAGSVTVDTGSVSRFVWIRLK
jgi:hypothetical protein